MSAPVRFAVESPMDCLGVKAAIVDMATEISFSAANTERALIAGMELCTNLVRHGSNGRQMLLRVYEAPPERGIELVGMDRGPGMTDPWAMVADGVSSRDHGGNGLGGIRRMSSEFDIYSQPGTGTVVLARIAASAHGEASQGRDFQVGGMMRPCLGEDVSGDAWATFQKDSVIKAMVCDGLGHGANAALAADEIVRVFREHASEPSLDLMARMHRESRHTRGAAVSLACIDRDAGRLSFVGCGNVTALIYGPHGHKRCMSHNGIVGRSKPAMNEISYDWPQNGVLLMYTDGLVSATDLERYPGLATRHAATIAAVMLRDGFRNRDDGTVLVVKSEALDEHPSRFDLPDPAR